MLATRNVDTYFYQPGDGFRYSIVLPDKKQAFDVMESEEEKRAYIIANYDRKDEINLKKITILAANGLSYSINSPEKLEAYNMFQSAEDKRAFVLENYDQMA